MNEYTDDELVQRCLKNDQEAGRELYMRYALFLYRLAYRCTLNQTAAEESSQETWLRIFQHMQRYQTGTSFRSWAAKICYNICIDRVRKSIRHQTIDQSVFQQLFHSNTLIPNEVAEQNEIVEKVMVYLSKIPATFRTAFSLRYFHQLSYLEIAEITGINVNTARSRVFRVTEELRLEFALQR